MKVKRVSVWSLEEHTMNIPIPFLDYHKGMFDLEFEHKSVHDCFPGLTLEQKQFLINGITPEEMEEIHRHLSLIEARPRFMFIAGRVIYDDKIWLDTIAKQFNIHLS